MNRVGAAMARGGIFAILIACPVAMSARESRADDVAYVDCAWSPYKDAWACALPAAFTEGRFAAPPDYRHDEASEKARQKTWEAAKAEPGARARGRMGVFVPKTDDGGWWFVPGASWSPGDAVFLAHARPPAH